MKKLAAITKGVCVNALVCSAAAILLSACGAGMPDATKSQPSKFAGVMQVSATVATNGPDADPDSAGAAADQAAMGAVPGASGAEQAVAGAAAPMAPAGVLPASADGQQASVGPMPATASADQLAAGGPAAPAAAGQGADSFALVGYGSGAARGQAASAAAQEGPVWPDPQNGVSAMTQ
jgi:hypothetical protein